MRKDALAQRHTRDAGKTAGRQFLVHARHRFGDVDEPDDAPSSAKNP
jgi:hypothetical protein